MATATNRSAPGVSGGAGHSDLRAGPVARSGTYYNKPADRLLSRLDGVRKTGDGRYIARCPAHHDLGPSLSLRELPDGRLLLHCFAGCPVSDVLGAVGLDFHHLFPDAPLAHLAPRERQPFAPLDVLKALAHEALVLQLIAEDMRNGPLTDEGNHRLDTAISRIREGVTLAEGARNAR